jgi:2,3-dihydroxybenzoate-AMP ligase
VVGEDGRPVPPGEIGELLTQGPCTLRGYYRAPEYNAHAFTPEGLLRTGDLVRMTAQGRLVVEGRIKDVINRGGEKVPAGEVEEHLRAHPAIREAAVVAVPDPSLGEKSCAVLVATGTEPSLEQLHDFLSARGLAGYKLPDRCEYVEALPWTPVGKVDKRALRERWSAARPVR